METGVVDTKVLLNTLLLRQTERSNVRLMSSRFRKPRANVEDSRLLIAVTKVGISLARLNMRKQRSDRCINAAVVASKHFSTSHRPHRRHHSFHFCVLACQENFVAV